MSTYVAGDVRSIQSFIFATPRLREMRGASALLDFFDRSVVPRLVKDFEGELISSGGGNFLARFEGGTGPNGAASRFRQRVEEVFFHLTGGHEIAVVERADEEAFETAQPALHQRLRQAKAHPGGARQLASMPFLKRCEGCGREAADMPWPLPGVPREDPRRQWLGPACHRKRSMHKELAGVEGRAARARHAVYGLDEKLEVPPVTERLRQAKLPHDFQELVKGDDLAILVADGNGLGDWFQGLDLERYRALSLQIDERLRKALDAATTAAFGTEEEPALQVLICGGDDLVAALPARYALAFAKELVRGFRVDDETGRREPAGLAAGLLLARHSFPFRPAHALAEELLQRAKQRCREDGVKSALHFHRVIGSHVRSLEGELGHLERDDGEGRGWAYAAAGPYTPEELEDLLALAGELKAKVTPSQRGRLREILSPRDDSRETPPDPERGVPARLLAELEAWRLRQEEEPFSRPVEEMWERYVRTEERPGPTGLRRTVHRWVLGDALTLADLREA